MLRLIICLFLITMTSENLLHANPSPGQKSFIIPLGNGPEELGYIPFDEGMEIYGETEISDIMEGPGAFNIDEAGNLYFLDLANNAIRKYDQTGKFLNSCELPRVDNQEPTYSDLQLAGPDLVFLSDIENNRFILFNMNDGKILKNIELPEREITEDSHPEDVNDDDSEEPFYTPYYLEDFRVLSPNKILFRDLYDNSVYSLESHKDKALKIEKQIHSEEVQLNLHQYINGAYAGFSASLENPEEILIYAINNESKELFSTGRFIGLGLFELINVEQDLIAMAFYQGGEAGVDLRELRLYKPDGTIAGRKNLNIAQLTWHCEKQIRYKKGTFYVLEYEEKVNGIKIHLISFRI